MVEPADDLGHDNPEVSKSNLVARICGATALAPHPETNETWVILRPIANNDWTLRRNTGADQKHPAQRFVFRSREAAMDAARTGDVVEGGWKPLPLDEDAVLRVVVHLADGTTKEFPGDIYDAVFWSKGAKEKFLRPYYTMTLALNASQAMASGPIGHERWSRQSSV